MSSRVTLKDGEKVLTGVVLLLCSVSYFSLIIPHTIFAGRALASNNSKVALNGVFSILSVNIMLVTAALAYNWFKINIPARFHLDYRSLILTVIAIYALSLTWIGAYQLPYWFSTWIGIRHQNILATFQVMANLTGIIAGTLLIKLSSSLIPKTYIYDDNRRLAALSLVGLSLFALLATVVSAVTILRVADASSTGYLVPNVVAYVSTCYLAFDVHRQGKLRPRLASVVLLVWMFASFFEYVLILRFGTFSATRIWRALNGPLSLYGSIGLRPPGFLSTVLATMGLVLLLGGHKVKKNIKILFSGSILFYALNNFGFLIYIPSAITRFLTSTHYLIYGSDLMSASSMFLSNMLGPHLFVIAEGVLLFLIGINWLSKPEQST